MATKVWQLGSPGSSTYKFFDYLRNGLNERLVEYLLKVVSNSEKMTVLEAGSGPAYASSLMAKKPQCSFSIACDIDFEAMEQARLRDTNLVVVVADLRNLPFKSESIDLCWNSSTVEHIPEPERAVQEMYRVLKKQGRAFIGVPYLFGPLGFQRFTRSSSLGIWIGEVFSKTGLGEMISRVGFKPTNFNYYFFRFFIGVAAEKK
jgi:SAM-dependent methyltransferase